MAPRAPQFLYTTVQSVKVRLGAKVQFQSGETPLQEEISDEMLWQLISDAEHDLEMALMSRYYLPFQGAGGAPFATLPAVTVHQIRKAVDMRAVILVLAWDFGRGGHTDGSEFASDLEKKYEEALELLLGREKVAQTDQKDRPRMAPPLPGLRLALTNLADKGTFGKVVNTDASTRDAASYANEQQNDPSLSYIPRGRTGQVL